MKILVVDDDRAVRDALRRALILGGYEVEVAESGAKAIELVVSDLPDAVVLDIGMPELDGLEVCRRLRLLGNRVPILMLTARDAIERPDRRTGRRRRRLHGQAVRHRGAEGAPARTAATDRARREPRRTLLRRGHARQRPARRRSRGAVVELTRTEYQLLELFMLNPKRVLLHSLIYDRVWGYDFGPCVQRLEGLHRISASQARRGRRASADPYRQGCRLRAARAVRPTGALR